MPRVASPRSPARGWTALAAAAAALQQALADDPPAARRLFDHWYAALPGAHDVAPTPAAQARAVAQACCVRALIAAAADSPRPLRVSPGLSQRLGECQRLAATRAERAGGEPDGGDLVEQLLATLDGARRRAHGVYFTPPAAVAFLLRAVDDVLRQDFGAPAGLATPAPPWRLLDPACGSGAFLAPAARFVAPVCGAPVCEAPVWGIEQWPAAALAAQRRLPASARIRLANTLSLDARALQQWLAPDRGDAWPIVVGNPPYSNFGRRPRAPLIDRLLDDYRRDLGERKLNLADDCIQFVRWGQYQIEQAGRGVLALVVSRTFLAGLTHRHMRRSLAATFDVLHVVDLGGDAQRRGRVSAPRDDNVFPGVRQGVALVVFARRGARPPEGPGTLHYGQLSGSRTDKLAALDARPLAEVARTAITPAAPDWPFLAAPRSAVGRGDAYATYPSLVEIFPEYISGVQTKCDRLLTAFTRDEAAAQVERLLATPHEVDAPEWLRARAEGATFAAGCLSPYYLAPLDRRWVYYDPRLLGRARQGVARQLLGGGNVGLAFMRQTTVSGPFDAILAIDAPASDRCLYSLHGAPYLAPLWLLAGDERRANLDAAVLDRLFAPLGETPAPLDVFDYIHGLLHWPWYRSRWRDRLAGDFPRIAPPADRRMFAVLRRAGRLLRRLHLAPPGAARREARLAWQGDAPRQAPLVVARGYPRWVAVAGDIGRIELNRAVSLAGVTAAAWRHTIGGYAVLPRWLAQRRGRALTADDRAEIVRLAAVLDATTRVKRRLDQTLPPPTE